MYGPNYIEVVKLISAYLRTIVQMALRAYKTFMSIHMLLLKIFQQIFLDTEDNRVVKDANCHCPMRQFKCHHVAAA